MSERPAECPRFGTLLRACLDVAVGHDRLQHQELISDYECCSGLGETPLCELKRTADIAPFADCGISDGKVGAVSNKVGAKRVCRQSQRRCSVPRKFPGNHSRPNTAMQGL